MSEVLFLCRTCSNPLSVSDAGIGKTFDCPTCGGKVIVPDPDLKFSCPSCRMALASPRGMARQKFDCPGCGKAVIIPEPEPVTPTAESLRGRIKLKNQETWQSAEANRCPSCGAEVADGATFCGNCGGSLEAEPEIRKKSGISLFFSRYKWAMVGTVVLLALAMAWKTVSDYRGRIQKRCRDAVASAKASRSIDESIRILQEVAREYPEHPASGDARKLLSARLSERNTLRVRQALAAAMKQAAEGEQALAMSNLVEVLNSYPDAPNIGEAKKEYGKLRKEQVEIQTGRVTKALEAAKSVPENELQAFLTRTAEENPLATNLVEVTNLLTGATP